MDDLAMLQSFLISLFIKQLKKMEKETCNFPIFLSIEMWNNFEFG